MLGINVFLVLIVLAKSPLRINWKKISELLIERLLMEDIDSQNIRNG